MSDPRTRRRRPARPAPAPAAGPDPAAQAQQAVQMAMDRRDNGGQTGQQAA